jgi:hypothetical protein
MTDELWRPLGFDGSAAADYDVLKDGVPEWMAASIWQWVRSHMLYTARSGIGAGVSRSYFSVEIARQVERVCRLQIGYYSSDLAEGVRATREAAERAGAELRVVDYLLSCSKSNEETLERILAEGGSAWTVGTRAGEPGLVRRVPEGAQVNAEFVMASAGQAGTRLRQAWERAFGVSPDPTGAYALAVRAVEDATVPVVVPKQTDATLGNVIGQLKSDGDWSLPLTREHDEAPTSETVVRMCQALYKGHHDRHGGAPGAPGTVSQEEAEAAVTLAVPLVQWFASGQVARRPQV